MSRSEPRGNSIRMPGGPKLAGSHRSANPAALLLTPFCLGALAILGCEKEGASSKSAERPNVLIVTFDTTRADYLSCYGRPGNTTPTLDRLAREGIRYANCYASAPITLPSHATIFTGLYPFQHGLHDNGTGPLDEKVVTLAEVLKAAGYRTGAVVGAYVLHSRFGLGQGFEFYGDEFPNKDGAPAKDKETEFVERDARAVTDAAVDWLNGVGDKPFFLWAHYFDPHAPYAAPNAPQDAELFASYAAEVTYADSQLDRLLTRVDQLSKSTGRKTLIVFVGDHGESLTEHGEASHAYFAYNATLHVPLMVKLPPGGRAGEVCSTPVSIADVFPSLLSWLGLEPPYDLPGHPLPATDSPADIDQPGRSIYFETYFPFNMYGWSPLEGVIVGRWKYIAAPLPELYYLEEDPRELENKIGAHRQQASQLAGALAAAKRKSPTTPAFFSEGFNPDSESIRKLRALGYVGTYSAPPDDFSGLPDPKTMLEVRLQLLVAEMDLDEGRKTKGFEDLESVLQRDPDNRQALKIASAHLNREGSRESALALLRRRIEKPLPSPFDAMIPATMGVALCRSGQFDEGVALLQRALGVAPGLPDYLHALGGCYLQANRLTEAAVQFETILRNDPKSPLGHEGIGDIRAREGDYPKAAEAYSFALAGNEAKADVHAKLGATFRKIGRPNDAVKHFKRALDLSPDMVNSRTELGAILMEQGRADEASREYEAVVKRKPDDPSARYDFGVSLAQSGRIDAAVAQFREAVRLNDAHGDAWINLGIALLQKGSPQEGMESLLRATKIEPSAGAAYYNLGIAAARQGRTDETVRYYELAIAANPPHSTALEELSSYYLREKRVGDAVRVLRVGAAAFPDNVKIINTLASILATSSDDSIRNGPEALKLASRAAELTQRRQPAVLATLAAALAETGEFPTAVDTARKALELTQNDSPPALRATIEAQLAAYQAARPFRNPRF